MHLYQIFREMVLEVTQSRTKKDFAHQMKDLVDVHFPRVEKIRVFLDNFSCLILDEEAVLTSFFVPTCAG
ncbi:transposase [Nostoc commune NIES-4072]|uniref:Transposase n=1 Tax=Nostoc commune NIES-4072 TaxID=2005467 RepID=A0A2R5FWW4_NOSCO|nr:transposase [Nostoc commune HK-02]GBG22775.1 transposase [Nostoc commune NIES-4072]